MSANPLIRVTIVDDQPLFASGLSMLIEAQPYMECVGTAINGQEAVLLSAQLRPDIMLMDLRMPVMNGLDATKLILAQSPPGTAPRVIVLTTIQKDEAVFLALKVGATAFLTKDATPARVLEAIRSANTERELPEGDASLRVVEDFAQRENPAEGRRLVANLTPKEVEIFNRVSQGLSNAEISGLSFLSEATVKSHVRAILHKLNLRSRVQVVIFAYENGLA